MLEITFPGSGKGGDQVFRAETQDELIEKLARAQSHATKKIREQAIQIKMLQELVTATLTTHVADKLKKV